MKTYVILLSLSVLLVFGCKGKEEKKESNLPPETMPEPRRPQRATDSLFAANDRRGDPPPSIAPMPNWLVKINHTNWNFEGAEVSVQSIGNGKTFKTRFSQPTLGLNNVPYKSPAQSIEINPESLGSIEEGIILTVRYSNGKTSRFIIGRPEIIGYMKIYLGVGRCENLLVPYAHVETGRGETAGTFRPVGLAEKMKNCRQRQDN